MQCFEPQEILFEPPKPSQFNEPISRISAGSYNSAAFNERGNMYVWGSASENKLGIGKNINTQDEPLYTEWKVDKSQFFSESGKPAVRHHLQFVDKNMKGKFPKGTQILNEMKTISFGESHSVMLDTKGRIFTMGASVCGRLGLSDKELPDLVKWPTQVTFGLPKPSF